VLSFTYTLSSSPSYMHTSPLLVMQLKHRNQRLKSLQILHTKKAFQSHFKSSQDAELRIQHHLAYNSHSQLRTNCKRTSVSPIQPLSDTRKTTVLLPLRHCRNKWHRCWHGHMTPPHSCVTQVFTAVACQGTCLPQCCIAMFTAQHHFLLLLYNRRVYRGAAYELPE
jgi:hypothetical protein